MSNMGTDISHHIEYDPASLKSPPNHAGSIQGLKHFQRGCSSSIDDASTTTSIAVSKRTAELLRKTYSMSVNGSPSSATSEQVGVEQSSIGVVQADSLDEHAAKNLDGIAEAEEYDEGANDETYAEEEDGEEYGDGPVAYDESCPAYYDIKREAYYYYGNVLYYDPDSECYYYYDWDQEDYLYVDEETQAAINEDTLTYWSEDDGMYHDPASWHETNGCGVEEPVENYAAEDFDEEDGEVEDKIEEPNVPPPEVKIFEAEGETESEIKPGDQNKDDRNLCPQPPTVPRRVLKSEVSAPRRSFPEKFNSGIDQFRSSESSLRSRTMDILMSVFKDRSDLLEMFEKKPNGCYKIGQSKRQISALIKGTIELKALCSTDCSSASASLEHLNLVQLLQIRHNARNSAWDRSPIHAHKTFAMKTDVMIAEKFLIYLLTGLDATDMSHLGDTPRISDLPVFEKRFIGSQAICVLGGLDELNESRKQILGDKDSECCKSNWWYLDSSPVGTVVPREKLTGPPKGLFFNISGYCKANPENTHFTVQFEWPQGVEIVYKLVEGRVCEGSMYWDVLAIPFIER